MNCEPILSIGRWPASARRFALRAVFILSASMPLAATGVALAQQGEATGSFVRINVDPRIELFSIIFRLADVPEFNMGRVPSYEEDVDRHFAAHRDHPVVQFARTLMEKRELPPEALLTLAVHVTDALALSERTPLDQRPKGLDARWSRDGARAFLAHARDFVRESDFRSFFENHKKLYEVTAERFREVLSKEAHMDWFSKFYRMPSSSKYIVVLGMLNGPLSYGPRFKADHLTEDIYYILGVQAVDEKGLPRFDLNLTGAAVHEFGHAYIDRLVDRHREALVDAGEKIFQHDGSRLKQLGYPMWEFVIYESISRACDIQYLRANWGPEAGDAALAAFKSREYVGVDRLSRLLEQYQAQTDKYPDFEAFFPRIVAFFNDYAKDL